MRVSVVGTGYVGLVSGVCLAEKGHEVICVDIDEAKINSINQGIPPIYEKGLESLLKQNIGQRFSASSDLRSAILTTDLSIIAVGTPFDGDTIDLTFIQAVSKTIGEVLRDKADYHVVVVKSTVVPGTTDDVVLPILEEASGKQAGVDFGVGMNPEFLREGEAVADFMNPGRIVLGALDSTTRDVLKALYVSFVDVPIVATSNKTAEMIKYASNSLLATMISFSNEIANLCAALGGIDVKDVMKGVHLDKGISPMLPDGSRLTPPFTSYIEAGCGFGGSCFPKDVSALVSQGQKNGQPMVLLDSVLKINAQQPFKILELVNKHFTTLQDVPLAVLGLAFKPGTDDMRESPAIPVIRELLARGARVKAFDPVACPEAQKIFGTDGIQYSGILHEAIDGVRGIIILTRWPEIQELPELLQKLDDQPVVIDGRRVIDKNSVRRYDGIGL
jgi:UDPglucose 6-dehydrogenase/GDP-mannose 6-dehydrogenase